MIETISYRLQIHLVKKWVKRNQEIRMLLNILGEPPDPKYKYLSLIDWLNEPHIIYKEIR